MCTASVLWSSTYPGSFSVCLSNVPLSRAWSELSLGPPARLSSLSHSIATADFRTNTHSRFSESMPQGPFHLLQWHLGGAQALPVLQRQFSLCFWPWCYLFFLSQKKYTYNIPQDEAKLHLPCILLHWGLKTQPSYNCHDVSSDGYTAAHSTSRLDGKGHISKSPLKGYLATKLKSSCLSSLCANEQQQQT